jgi:uncharacterized protein (DUF1697 family)
MAITKPARYIALLRGVNVGGYNKVPMSELRAVAAKLGWTNVVSYIQSGNLVLDAPLSRAEVEAQLENAIKLRFKVAVPVIARSAREWDRFIKSLPFRNEAKSTPQFVQLGICKTSPNRAAAAALQERGRNSERVKQAGDALFIHFPEGVGKSKITPAVLDRLVGSPVTLRNWLTVVKLSELASRAGSGEK